jgi:UDP-3-O-[3-hydroxymyristoyl] glucosamine N-acyltransferase
MSKINSLSFKQSTGIELTWNFECKNIGMLNSKIHDTFSFLEEEKYIAIASKNDNIKIILVPQNFSHQIDGKKIIKVSDPRKVFYLFFNFLLQFKEKKNTKISQSAIISNSADIAKNNVIIGERTIIGENVVIKEDVYIGDDVNISSGTIIGGEGLELKKIDNINLRISHDKSVFIENNVNIGSNCVIDKGIYRDTIIRENTNIDSLVHIAHACHINKNVIIGSGSIILGSVTIGDNVWIGPNSTISNGIEIENDAFVVLGSVVIENVKPKSKISGNFATNHLFNLINYKKRRHE